MQPAGMATVERAKQDGRWDAAYDSHSTATVPSDFQAALDGNAEAGAFFAGLNSTNRYAILFRIQTAKKAETRAKRQALRRFTTQMHVMDWFLDGFARSNEVFSRPADTRVALPSRRNLCCDR